MDIIRASHYSTPLDVIMDGRYIFRDAFHGIVAVATDIRDDNFNLIGYKVEHTLAIDQSTIKRVIRNHRKGLHDVLYEFDTKKYVGSLPYGIKIELYQ